MELSGKIEALLFFRGEPMRHKELAKVLEAKEGDVTKALKELKEKLSGRGLSLVEKDDEVELRTAPEASELIERIRKEELTRDLGKAGAETLSIVLYRGPSTRSEIDYIRGVNSTFILRNLMVRGLVERVQHPADLRSFVYKPTFELLSHLGVRNIQELPEYAAVQAELEKFVAEEAKAEEKNNGEEE
ncbi:MAG TPA: SMC-Scp complex subunit ScpB [Candidatus Paceibacterota bacterium]